MSRTPVHERRMGMSLPSKAMWPVWPVVSPDTSWSSVDLPEPLGPTTATARGEAGTLRIGFIGSATY
eukprot:gene5357-6831_t